MMHPHAIVLPSPGRGIGVYATAPISAGTAIWGPCPHCPRYDPRAIRRMPSAQRAWITEYGYGRPDGGMMVCCPNGHLLNHSCDANVLDYGLDFGVAVRDIAAGEEIEIDYRTFIDDPDFVFRCTCGSPECIGDVRPEQDLQVIATWRERLTPVLARIAGVPQPCHEALHAVSAIYRGLCRKPRRFRWQEEVSVREPGFLARPVPTKTGNGKNEKPSPAHAAQGRTVGDGARRKAGGLSGRSGR